MSSRKVFPFLPLGTTFVVMGGIWSVFLAWIAGSVAERIAGEPAIKLA